jgi:uncharacterized protein YdeI (YjbR/CyaY-like superfamily)
MSREPTSEPDELLLADAAAWRAWLQTHHGTSTGVRLVLARKDGIGTTRLTHADALLEALCYGWIDGQAKKRDSGTWTVRFTPRRRRSTWSKRNVGIAESLIAEGRMTVAGLAEVERAKADGRWQAAYSGPAEMEVPSDLEQALLESPTAARMFAQLNSQNRYAILFRIHNARRADTRAKRIRTFVEMLSRGETIYPQRTS